MADVSRETPPSPPEAAGVFASRLPHARQYADLLATTASVRGLIGPREVPRLWERHLLNCAVVTDVLPEGAAVCDIGSGAGLPGLVLAIRRPDLRLTLVEPLLRRTTFLEEAVDALGLDNVEVLRERAEALAGQRQFAVVTSRAVAPLEKLVAWSLPLVEAGGVMVAMKGESAEQEAAAAAATVAQYGGDRPEVLHIPVPGVVFPTTVVRVRVASARQLGWSSRRTKPSRATRRPYGRSM